MAKSNPKAVPDSVMETRRDALAAVRRKVEESSGAGKMKGKVGIITGVGPISGIGTATARLMAREGAEHLFLLDYNKDQLNAFVEKLSKEFPKTKITHVSADAASASAISSLVNQAIEKEGHLDFFFANAGISQIVPKTKSEAAGGDLNDKLREIQKLTANSTAISEEDYMEVMRINALGVFIAIKYAVPALNKVCPEKGKTIPGGSLILTASIAGVKANAGPLHYSASKAAVVSMAQTAAYDLTGKNIRVNAICPGLIETDMTRAMFDLAKMAGKNDKMGTLNPLLRQGLGHEIAQVALFLASEDSSYVNGQAIAVDGGLTAGVPYVRAKI